MSEAIATTVSNPSRHLVIGGGSSGLAAAKALLEYGFEVDVVERESDLGGNWHFGKPNARVYASTHMISSKPFTSYPDFPMPDRFPDYPHHSQVLEYLRSYARHFGLDDLIQFDTSVEHMEPVGPESDSGWQVHLRRGERTESRTYASVTIANGHNWFPKRPEIPGRFDGKVLHSADYREPSVFRGKRVLVVGAGNTGCDLVVEAAQNAARTFHSTRRGYWYAQKYTFGRPSDQIYDALLSLRLPLPVLRFLLETTAKLTVGDLTKFGLPKPDHRFLETHPIVNSLLVYYVGHGDITPKTDVQAFDGDEVVFTDGSREEIDLVLFATGYLIKFPFLDVAWTRDERGRPNFHKNVFHPERNDLFVVGLIQPDSGQFKLVHWQAVGVARYLRARSERPAQARAFESAKALPEGSESGGVKYKDSTRHLVEVNHMGYLRRFDQEVVQKLEVPVGRSARPFRERVMTPLDWSFPVASVPLELLHRSGGERGVERPPLLFVHGLGHGAWCWAERWMPTLAERGWDTWALSLRGHGASGGRHGSFRAYARDLMEAITRLPRTPILVGHSMGAVVVQRVIEAYAARGAVMLAPAAPGGSLRASLYYAIKHPLSFLRVLSGRKPLGVAQSLFSDDWPEDAEAVAERMSAPGAMNVLRLATPRRGRPARCPVAVLGAEGDEVAPRFEVMTTARHYGVSPVWLKGGHDLMLGASWLENLDAFEQTIMPLAEAEAPRLRALPVAVAR